MAFKKRLVKVVKTTIDITPEAVPTTQVPAVNADGFNI